MFLAESTIQLVPDGTMLVHIVIIAVMVVVLNRTLLKPINEILARRDALLSGRFGEAQILTEARAEKLREYEEAMRQARTEGYHLLEAEKAAALSEKERRLREAKDQISKEVALAVETTRRQQDDAKNALEKQAHELSGLIGTQVLRRPLQ